MALHVVVGQEDFFDELEPAARKGSSIRWIISKAATPGDPVLLYFRHLDAFIGRGEVISTPEPTTFGKRHCYVADVGEIHLFKRKVGLGVVADEFPDWEWPRNPRSFVSNKLPENLLDAIMRLAGRAEP